jgi:hypothetical protein
VTATFPLESFGLLPGDVVSIDGRDLWVGGVWLLSESDLPVAAFYFAADATLGVLAAPRTEVHLLAACQIDVAADPPFSLEHGGTHFEREHRLPVELTSFGNAPALPVHEALFLEYRGFAGDVLFVLAQGCRSWTWLGRSLDRTRVERWGPGV